MKIFETLRERLKGTSTAAGYDDVIPKLEAALSESNGEFEKLQAKRETVIFEGTAEDLKKLESDIARVTNERANIQAAVTGAQRRRDEAAEREEKAAVEKRMADARRLVDDQRQLLKQFDKQAKALADTAGRLRDVMAAITTENEFARANGRSDLMLTSVYTELFRLESDLWDAYWSKQGKRPINRPQPIPDPTLTLRIPYHWPTHAIGAHMDGANSPFELLK